MHFLYLASKVREWQRDQNHIPILITVLSSVSITIIPSCLIKHKDCVTFEKRFKVMTMAPSHRTTLNWL